MTACMAFALLLAGWAGEVPVAAAEPPSRAGEAGWVCPPCGHTEHDTVYDEPGRCPICGMRLVRKNERVRTAILVFDGVQIIDYTAPYEVFGQAGFDVYTVSPDGGPVTTAMDMHVTPHLSIEDAPRPDVVLVPGGDIGAVMADERVIAWIRETAGSAEHVLSVCTGAFLLAEAGLLDGARATTFHRALDDLATDFPAIDVVRGVRFVDNGKVVTAAGLSAGLDAALYLVEEIRGSEAARNLADHLEYAWNAEPGTAQPVRGPARGSGRRPDESDTAESEPGLGQRRSAPPFRTFGRPASAENAEAIDELMSEFRDAWRAQDVERLAGLHAPDVEWINAYARMFRGSGALRTFLETKLFPEFDPAVSRQEAANMRPVSRRYLGDDAAVVHWVTDSARGPSRNASREGIEGFRRTHLHFVLEQGEDGWRIAHEAIFDAR